MTDQVVDRLRSLLTKVDDLLIGGPIDAHGAARNAAIIDIRCDVSDLLRVVSHLTTVAEEAAAVVAYDDGAGPADFQRLRVALAALEAGAGTEEGR